MEKRKELKIFKKWINQRSLFDNTQYSWSWDFNKNKKARGISLYTLSERASDKEAEALARRENKSDLFGNVDLSDETSEVINILIDLTKRETLNQSSHLVNFLIKEFKISALSSS